MWRDELGRSLAAKAEELTASHEASLRDAVAATAAERDRLIDQARDALERSEEGRRAAQESEAAARREAEEREESARRAHRAELEAATAAADAAATAAAEEMSKQKEAVAMATAVAAEAAEAESQRRQQELEAATSAAAAAAAAAAEAEAEQREAAEAALRAAQRDHGQALAALREEASVQRRAMEDDKQKAVRDAERAERERAELRAQQQAQQAQQALLKGQQRARKEEHEAARAREAAAAETAAVEKDEAVRAAVEAERRELERRHGEEIEKVARAGALAARVATKTARASGTGDGALVAAAAEKRAGEERERRRAAEAALEKAAKEWGVEVILSVLSRGRYIIENACVLVALRSAAGRQDGTWQIRTARRLVAPAPSRCPISASGKLFSLNGWPEPRPLCCCSAQLPASFSFTPKERLPSSQHHRRYHTPPASHVPRLLWPWPASSATRTSAARHITPRQITASLPRLPPNHRRRRRRTVLRPTDAKRAEALAKQDRAHRDTVQAALTSLASEKDSALQAAVDSERRRAEEAETRAASSEARAAEAEAAR